MLTISATMSGTRAGQKGILSVQAKKLLEARAVHLHDVTSDCSFSIAYVYKSKECCDASDTMCQFPCSMLWAGNAYECGHTTLLPHLVDSETRVNPALLIRVPGAGYLRAFQCRVAGALVVDQTSSRRGYEGSEGICGCYWRALGSHGQSC